MITHSVVSFESCPRLAVSGPSRPEFPRSLQFKTSDVSNRFCNQLWLLAVWHKGGQIKLYKEEHSYCSGKEMPKPYIRWTFPLPSHKTWNQGLLPQGSVEASQFGKLLELLNPFFQVMRIFPAISSPNVTYQPLLKGRKTRVNAELPTPTALHLAHLKAFKTFTQSLWITKPKNHRYPSTETLVKLFRETPTLTLSKDISEPSPDLT